MVGMCMDMQSMRHSLGETPRPVDLAIELLHAVENNAADEVARLMHAGADPHRLLTIEHSQFRSLFKNSDMTEISPLYRALCLYGGGDLVLRMLDQTASLDAVPPAYTCHNRDRWDTTAVHDTRRSPTRTHNLFVALCELPALTPDLREELTARVTRRLSMAALDSLHATGVAAAAGIEQYMLGAPVARLSRALSLFTMGATLACGAPAWRALAELTRPVTLGSGVRLDMALPAYVMLAAPERVGALTLELLMENQACAVDTCMHGLTLLQWSAYKGVLEAAELLLLAGADARRVVTENCFDPALTGLTALEIACARGHDTIAAMLHAFRAHEALQATLARTLAQRASTPA